ncbi:hypothetical protein NFI96_023546 [Prochilodus magdalenae]|nr:hypothetical protein NFI96_023546 [Prochilodus magdalenae]
MEGENAATLSCKENKEQAALPQKDIKEYKAMLENETTERAARDELKEIRHKEAALAELQSNVQDDSEVLRRSDRSRVLTEKMLAYQRDEQSKKERRLVNLYEQWKAQARKARQELKSDLSEKHLSALIDSLEERKNDIMKVYNELRVHSTPAAELRRKVDACEAVTNDITKVVFERLTGVNGDFDAEYEGRRLPKSISTSDKLHYLKRYVSGPAYKCVEGTFYRDDEEAYKDAWNKLNQRVMVQENVAIDIHVTCAKGDILLVFMMNIMGKVQTEKEPCPKKIQFSTMKRKPRLLCRSMSPVKVAQNYGLKQLAKEHSLTHPQAAQFIARDFYVDDGVSSFESEEEAIQLAKEARELCAKGGASPT